MVAIFDYAGRKINNMVPLMVTPCFAEMNHFLLSCRVTRFKKVVTGFTRTVMMCYSFSISEAANSISVLIYSGERSNDNPAALYSSGNVLVPPMLSACI